MGSDASFSEKPAHLVQFSEPFYISATEITAEQYRTIMDFDPSAFAGVDLPVTRVKWADAVEFCRRLTALEREIGNIPPGLEYRLPTEAEWEYCCRAGTTTDYYFSDKPNKIIFHGWIAGSSNEAPHAVADRVPNAWGLYDTIGNVSEWCLDWYEGFYRPDGDVSVDPVGPPTGDTRVVRGGDFRSLDEQCRSACRCGVFPDFAGNHYGFRIVVASGLVREKMRKKVEEHMKEEARKAEELRNRGKYVPLRFVAISPGSFVMGSKADDEEDGAEMPTYRVKLTYAFSMGETEVTQAQFRTVMAANPSKCMGDSLPVDSVNWEYAMEFCHKLTELERAAKRLPDGMVYRLPTEAEWEYCCRAGGATEYSFGDDVKKLGDFAWFSANSEKGPHPVGTRKPNAWGLYDMHGNVCEWCLDLFAGDEKAAEMVDPVGSSTGAYRGLRGGSWLNEAVFCRSSARDECPPEGMDDNFGFRVVLGPKLPK